MNTIIGGIAYPTYQYRKIINFLLLTNRTQEEIEDTAYIYQVEEDNSATLIYYYGDNINIKTPKHIDGHAVKRIAVTCYAYNSNILSIIIPDGIITVD